MSTRFWAGGGPYEGKSNNPWSAFKLGGQWFPGADDVQSPGVIPAFIEGLKLEYRIDSQKVKGHSGHRLVVEGYKPTPFTIRCRITSEEQLEAYRAYFDTINPKLKANLRKAYEIAHPFLALYSVRFVFINAVTQPDEADGRMVRDIKLTAWEVFGIQDDSARVVKATDTQYGGNVITEGRNQGTYPPGTVVVPTPDPNL